MSAGAPADSAARPRSVAVRVPATSANLGPGFDTLGLALSVYDELVVTERPAGELVIEVEGEGQGAVPLDDSHLVVRAMMYAYASVGRELPGIHIRAHNRIPHGRGMGSSAAAVVAGLRAAQGLLDGEVVFSDDELLRLATDLEGHPDNAAPALSGGLTIAWTTPEGPRSKKLLLLRGVSPLVLVPDFQVSTSLARSLQGPQVAREDAVFNVSRSALLIVALTQSPELLLQATEDKLHQDVRAQAMPRTAEVVRALRAEGHPAVVSGAGPSVLVLSDGPAGRLDAIELVERTSNTPWQPLVLAVDVRGATVRNHTEGSTLA